MIEDEADDKSERSVPEPADDAAGAYGERPEPGKDPHGEDREPTERGVASVAAQIASGAAVVPVVPDSPDDEHPTPI
jgi:hypothetical protein